MTAPGAAARKASGPARAELRPLDREAVARVLNAARYRDEGVLLETEGLALLDALGIATPRRIEVRDAAELAAWQGPPLPGERVVVKVVAPGILHKTEAGGVRIVANRREAIAEAIADMARAFHGQRVAGYAVLEFIPHDASLGHEFLLGLRWSREFGPVVTLGSGGIHAEFLAGVFREGCGLAVTAPFLVGEGRVEAAIASLAPARLVTETHRGQPPELPAAALAEVVHRFLALAAGFSPDPIAEFEVNPLVVSDGRLVALDALLKFGAPAASLAVAAPRPIDKIERLLRPRSIAVVGVSDKLNPGRIILQNILHAGYPRERVVVVKQGRDSIDGCRCVPSLAELGQPVDLVVLSVAAEQAAAMLADIADHGRAESVVLIPGGLEEKPGSERIVAHMRESLANSRQTAGRGPVVNGGNCLGVQSMPGRFNTLFIPEHKLPLPQGHAHPLALITGSGAFAVSKLSKLQGLVPRYTITIGNQMDLTAGDYLRHLAADADIDVFAVYLEGFKTLDGADFLEAADAITRGGRTVILYRAGRTQAGAAAAASHTAAVAGDARVGKALAEASGVVWADTLEDFEDLTRLFVLLRGRPPRGRRLAAITNAGYESVAIADRLGRFELAAWSEPTARDMAHALERLRLQEIVAVRNPIDLTPILDDEGYEHIVRAALADPGVDAALVGVVPMTGALNTLRPSVDHTEDLNREGGVVARLVGLRDAYAKPWVVVVDAGRLYDAMAQRLEDGGLPVFRAADRAMRLFGTWCEAVLARR